MIDDQQLLAAKPDVNYKELTSQPSPQDFLVLTRVKGVVSVAQLCAVSGLGRDKTLAAIEVLLGVGLLQKVDADGNPIEEPKKPAPAPPPPRPEPKPEPRPEPVSATPPSPDVSSDDILAPDDETAMISGVEAASMALTGGGGGSNDGETAVVSGAEAAAIAMGTGAPSDDATAVMSSAEAVALASGGSSAGAMLDDEVVAMPPPQREPSAIFGPDDDIFVPSAEPSSADVGIDISLSDALGDFEVDHQPIAAAASDDEFAKPLEFGADFESDPALGAKSSVIIVDEFTPKLEDEPPAQPHSSFATISPQNDDDDLFESDSPAHIDRIEGRAPIKRDHGRSRVSEAKEAVEKAKQAPPQVSPVNVSNYRFFPVKFTDYQSPHDRIPDVDEAIQKEIDFVFDHLEYVDFYQLFGVDQSADRKEIRARYFEMSKQFHPDKFFRDDVGAIHERVDAIFRFVTKGYKILSKKNKRAEYDEALARARAQAEQASDDEDRKRAMAADMLERRAGQLEQQGQLAQAAAEFKKVGTLRRDPRAFVKAASLLLRANQKLDEAATLARAAVQELPLEVEPRLVLGQIYEKNQMLAEAAEVFEQAEAIAPDHPSVRVHLERVRSQR